MHAWAPVSLMVVGVYRGSCVSFWGLTVLLRVSRVLLTEGLWVRALLCVWQGQCIRLCCVSPGMLLCGLCAPESLSPRVFLYRCVRVWRTSLGVCV